MYALSFVYTFWDHTTSKLLVSVCTKHTDNKCVVCSVECLQLVRRYFSYSEAT